MGTDEQQPKKASVGEKIKQLPSLIKRFWKEPLRNDRYLNLKEVLSLGGSAMGVSTIVCIVSSLLTASQISEVYGIDVIHGPYICLAASLLGLIIQPFFSKLLQNTHTRFGRYKPYIFLMAPIFAGLAIAATWQPQNLDDSARVIYAYCICIPTLVMWNLFNNTFQMMPGVVTPNQQERTDAWAPIGLLVGFAPTIMNVIIGPIRSHFLSLGQEYMAYRYMGLICSVVGILLVMLLVKVKERVIITNSNNENVGVIEGLKMVLKNKPLIIFTLALILGCMRSTIEIDAQIMGKLRYATDIETGLTVFSSLTLITGFAVTPNMILLPLLTRKFNNRTIVMFWAFLNFLGYIILAVVGVQNIPQGTVSAVVLTLLRYIALFNGITSLQPLMLSEISDYQQVMTGKRLEGFIQMFAYTLVLVFTNIGYVVMAYVKQAMGYQPANYFNVTTVSDELMNTAINYYNVAFYVSAISAALMCLMMLFYKLDKKKHAEIVEELRRRSLAEGHGELAIEPTGNEEVPAGVDTDAGEYQQEMMLAANVSKENPSGGADDTFEESGAATDGGTDVPEPDGGTDDTAEESSSEGEDTGNN